MQLRFDSKMSVKMPFLKPHDFLGFSEPILLKLVHGFEVWIFMISGLSAVVKEDEMTPFAVPIFC